MLLLMYTLSSFLKQQGSYISNDIEKHFKKHPREMLCPNNFLSLISASRLSWSLSSGAPSCLFRPESKSGIPKPSSTSKRWMMPA